MSRGPGDTDNIRYNGHSGQMNAINRVKRARRPTLPLMPTPNAMQGSSPAYNPRDRLGPRTVDLQQHCGRHSMRQ
jgi:hypothetical protein